MIFKSQDAGGRVVFEWCVSMPVSGRNITGVVSHHKEHAMKEDAKAEMKERLPYRDNLQDNCTVLATGDGYVGAGFTPVKLSLAAVAMVDLMLLEDDATFKFLSWDALKTAHAVVAKFHFSRQHRSRGASTLQNLQQNKPAALASLLNLATAMKAIYCRRRLRPH